jgi:hypothetical protein
VDGMECTEGRPKIGRGVPEIIGRGNAEVIE